MTRAVDVTRVSARALETRRDAAACEEPIEVRVGGRPFAVIMRWLAFHRNETG